VKIVEVKVQNARNRSKISDNKLLTRFIHPQTKVVIRCKRKTRINTKNFGMVNVDAKKENNSRLQQSRNELVLQNHRLNCYG
jgi:hypothetical protein